MDSFVVNLGNKEAVVTTDDGFITVHDEDSSPAVIEFPIKGEVITSYEDSPALIVKLDFETICNNIKKYYNYDAVISITQLDIDDTSVYIAFEAASGGDEPPLG